MNENKYTFIDEIKIRCASYISYSDFVMKNLDTISVVVIFFVIMVYIGIIYFKY